MQGKAQHLSIAPPGMRTRGMSALKCGYNASSRRGMKVKREKFVTPSKKKSLIDAENKARGFINLVCDNHGRSLNAECEMSVCTCK